MDLDAAFSALADPTRRAILARLAQGELGADETQKLAWSRHWIETGFEALEAMLANSSATGRYCHGDTPGLADACLVPQVYNAMRWQLPMDRWPTIARIHAACNELEAFQQAMPERQPDAPAAA